MANTSPGFANLPEGGDESNGNDMHGSPAGRRGLPKAVREPPRLHDAVHAAASRDGTPLLFPAKQKRNRDTPDADRRNHPPTLGRHNHGRPVRHQPRSEEHTSEL